MTDNWQSLIVAICIAVAAWWLGKRVGRFVRALRNPADATACGGCEQCPSHQPAQTESGMPIVDLHIGDKRPIR